MLLLYCCVQPPLTGPSRPSTRVVSARTTVGIPPWLRGPARTFMRPALPLRFALPRRSSGRNPYLDNSSTVCPVPYVRASPIFVAGDERYPCENVETPGASWLLYLYCSLFPSFLFRVGSCAIFMPATTLLAPENPRPSSRDPVCDRFVKRFPFTCSLRTTCPSKP